MAIGITRNTQSVSTIKKNQSGNKAEGGAGKSSKTSDGGSSSKSDSVNLTVSAGQLQELEDRINNMTVVDVQAVESVQQQLNSGNYEIDDESTADKIIESERDLAGSD
mgnify:FL=1